MSQAPGTPPPSSQGYYGGGGFPPMPVPNGELIVYIVALLVAGLVTLLADSIAASDWLGFATWATAAYLISRGLAKLRNVTEH